MTLLVPFFFAHQPYRLRSADARLSGAPLPAGGIEAAYFEGHAGRASLIRAAEKCYRPATRLILDLVRRFSGSDNAFKVAFGLSGTLLDQAGHDAPDLLELWQELSATGQVEFTGETYYHSLAGLYDEARVEFREQVALHWEAVRSRLGHRPTVFRNTGMLYNDAIAAAVQEMGFTGMMTEGVDWLMAGWRSPDFVYQSGLGLPVLLRNYRLSDDIGFRFADRHWEGYPLTAEKFAGWLAGSSNPVILLAMDYETLGDYLSAETGIFDFLAALPEQIARFPHLEWATPSEAFARLPAAGRIDVPVYSTISWADQERDTSAWLGNELQQFCFEEVKRLEPMIRASGQPELLEAWRRMQASDYLSDITDKFQSESHRRFSVDDTAAAAFQRLHSALYDLKRRAAQFA